LSAAQQEKYFEQHGNNFANDSQVAAQAVLTPDEQAAATMVKPDKPEKPNNLSQYKAMFLSQLRGSGNFAAVNSGEYVQLAEAEHAKAEADYKEAMIKYKAMLEIWKSSRDK
jgi:exopolysaccharide biosynthesis protein